MDNSFMNMTFWFLPFCFLSFAHATVTAAYEFRECPNKQDARRLNSCIKECTSIGFSTSSYTVDLSLETVSESVWEKGNKLTQSNLLGCRVIDTENWRCQSDSKVMGGIVRRDHYAISGRVFLNISGSGGEQYYCSVEKNKPNKQQQ